MLLDQGEMDEERDRSKKYRLTCAAVEERTVATVMMAVVNGQIEKATSDANVKTQ